MNRQNSQDSSEYPKSPENPRPILTISSSILTIWGQILYLLVITRLLASDQSKVTDKIYSEVLANRNSIETR